jgi:hypothetical protein
MRLRDSRPLPSRPDLPRVPCPRHPFPWQDSAPGTVRYQCGSRGGYGGLLMRVNRLPWYHSDLHCAWYVRPSSLITSTTPLPARQSMHPFHVPALTHYFEVRMQGSTSAATPPVGVPPHML